MLNWITPPNLGLVLVDLGSKIGDVTPYLALKDPRLEEKEKILPSGTEYETEINPRLLFELNNDNAVQQVM